MRVLCRNCYERLADDKVVRRITLRVSNMSNKCNGDTSVKHYLLKEKGPLQKLMFSH